MAKEPTIVDGVHNKMIYRFQDCLSSELSSLEFYAGTLIYCRDTGECFYDTPNGERVPVSKYVRFFATEAERTSCLDFDTSILYIVTATKKMYVYAGGWVCLNPDIRTAFYFDIENVEVPTGSTGLSVSDSRITTSCTGNFVPLPSLNDLFGSATVTCTSGSAKIVLADTNYKMIGTLKISGTKVN